MTKLIHRIAKLANLPVRSAEAHDGESAATSIDSQQFSINLSNSEKAKTAWVSSFSGWIMAETTEFSSVALSVDEKLIADGLLRALNKNGRSISKADVIFSANQASVLLCISSDHSDDVKPTLCVELNFGRFSSNVILQIQTAFVLGAALECSVNDLVEAFVATMNQCWGCKFLRRSIEEYSMSIEEPINSALNHLWPSTKSYIPEFSISPNIRIDLGTSATGRSVVLGLPQSGAEFEQRRHEKAMTPLISSSQINVEKLVAELFKLLSKEANSAVIKRWLGIFGHFQSSESQDSIDLLQMTMSRQISGRSNNKLFEALDLIVSTVESHGFEIERAPILNSALCLLYADCWKDIDVKMSLLAMKRLSQTTEFSFNVCQQTLGMIAKLGSAAERNEWMTEFESAWKGSNFLVALNLAKAKEFSKSEREKAKSLVMKLIESHDADVDILLMASAILNDYDFWQESFVLLTRADDLLKLDKIPKALIKLKIAEVLLEHMEAPDLGIKYLSEVKDVMPEHPSYIKLMQVLHRLTGQNKELAASLDRELKSMSDLDIEATTVKRISNELVSLYSESLGDAGSLLKLYGDRSNVVDIDTESFLRALNNDMAKKNWTKFYQEFLTIVEGQPDPERNAKVHVCLGLICREKLNRHDDAVMHFIKAVRLGWIDPSSFNYLHEMLSRSSRYAELFEVLLFKIQTVSGKSRLELIRDLMNLDLNVDHAKLDDYALEFYREFEDERGVVKRFNYHLERSDFKTLERFVVDIENHSLSPDRFNNLVGVLIDSVIANKGKDKFYFLGLLYTRKMEYEADQVLLAKSAIKALKKSQDSSLLAPFVALLIDKGVLPELTEDLILNLLSADPARLSAYYVVRSSSASDPKKKAQLLREAVDTLKGDSEKQADVTRMIFMLAKLGRMSTVEIDDLRARMVSEDDWRKFAVTLQSQIAFETDRAKLSALYAEVISIYQNKVNDQKLTIKAFDSAIAADLGNLQLTFEFIMYLAEEGLEGLELSYLKKWLEDDAAVNDFAKTAVVLDRLFYSFQESELAFEKTKKWIAANFDKSNFNAAGVLADLLIGRGKSDSSIIEASLFGSLSRQDHDLAVDRCVLMINECKTAEDLNKFFATLESAVKKSKADLSYNDYFAKIALCFGDIDCDEDVKVLCLQECVLQLYKHEDYIPQLFEVLKFLKPETLISSQKLWMPIYLLLKDYGNDEQMRLHLSVIVPLLAKDNSILSTYPFTAESLGFELQALERALKNPSENTKSDAPRAVTQVAPQVQQKADDKISLAKAADETRSRSDGNMGAMRGNLAREWRGIAAVGNVSAWQVKQLRTDIFEQVLEKHTALQVFSVLAGDYSQFDDWPWKIWRYPEQVGYPFDGRGRYPSSFVSKGLTSKLAKFLLVIANDLVAYHRSRFKAASLAVDLGVSVEELERRVKPVNFNDYIIRSSNMIHIAPVLKKRRIQLYNLPGMGARIFFSGENRSVFFDVEHYKDKPQSHLFHRLYGVLWAAKLNYLPLQLLNPETEILPFLNKLREYSVNIPLAKAKVLLKSAVDPKEAVMLKLLSEGLNAELEGIGPVSVDDIQNLSLELNRHVQRLLLAETLDFIGLCEAITDKDLLVEPYDAKILIANSDDLKRLIDFAVMLKFS